MIKANELRLGNWVKLISCADDKDFCIVNCITASDPDRSIGLVGNGILNYPHQLAPIPLTPELLEKAGFEKIEVITKGGWTPDGHTITYYQKHITDLKTISIRIQETPSSEINFVFENPLGGYIKHVHSLQNLIYSLTGTELEINL